MKKIYSIGLVLFGVFVWFLWKVFSGEIIVGQSLSFSFITIRYYGVCMALAVLVGYVLARSRSKIYGIHVVDVDDIIFWLIVGGFIGARLYHVISSGSYYWYHPLQILEVWKGGLSIYGALFGGAVALYVQKKSKKISIPLLALLDWLVPSLAAGQIIGRFGNFFNYELFGYPTTLPWKMFVPLQFRPLPYLQEQFFHPLFLYEAIGSCIIFYILLKFFQPALENIETARVTEGKILTKDVKKNNQLPKWGTLFFIYLLLYNCLRFLLEYMRIDSVFYHGIRVNAMVSLALLAIAGGWLFWKRILYVQIS